MFVCVCVCVFLPSCLKTSPHLQQNQKQTSEERVSLSGTGTNLPCTRVVDSPLLLLGVCVVLSQAFLLGIIYVIFALWRLIEIVQDDLGGNTLAAEFMLFIKTRQVGRG